MSAENVCQRELAWTSAACIPGESANRCRQLARGLQSAAGHWWLAPAGRGSSRPAPVLGLGFGVCGLSLGAGL